MRDTWGKGKWSAAQFQYISIVLHWAYNKNKPYKTLDDWSWDMHDLEFLERCLRIVSPPYLMHDSFKKIISYVVLY